MNAFQSVRFNEYVLRTAPVRVVPGYVYHLNGEILGAEITSISLRVIHFNCNYHCGSCMI